MTGDSSWQREYKEPSFHTDALRPVTLTDQDVRDVVDAMRKFWSAGRLGKSDDAYDFRALQFKVDEHVSTDPSALESLPQEPSTMMFSAGSDFFLFLGRDGASIWHTPKNPEAVELAEKVKVILSPRQVSGKRRTVPSPVAVLSVVIILVGAMGSSLLGGRFFDGWNALIVSLPASVLLGVGVAALNLKVQNSKKTSILARYQSADHWWDRHYNSVSLSLMALAVVAAVVMPLLLM